VSKARAYPNEVLYRLPTNSGTNTLAYFVHSISGKENTFSSWWNKLVCLYPIMFVHACLLFVSKARAYPVRWFRDVPTNSGTNTQAYFVHSISFEETLCLLILEKILCRWLSWQLSFWVRPWQDFLANYNILEQCQNTLNWSTFELLSIVQARGFIVKY
jgi:hypothetical protein